MESLKLPIGKGYFIWQLGRIGDLQAAAKLAKDAGLSWIAIKCTDGIYPFKEEDPPTGVWIDHVPAAVSAFKDQGIQVWGWGFVYGNGQDAEAQAAVDRVKSLDLAGWIIDAELQYDNKFTEAALYMGALRTRMPGVPIGICSWRFPGLHPECPWKHFLTADFNIPQVYWQGSHNAGTQLEQSKQEFDALYASLGIKPIPFIPLGAAYGENGWRPTVAEILDFIATAEALNLTGYSWWEWYDATKIYPDYWPATTGGKSITEVNMTKCYGIEITRDVASIDFTKPKNFDFVALEGNKTAKDGAGVLPDIAVRVEWTNKLNVPCRLDWDCTPPESVDASTPSTLGDPAKDPIISEIVGAVKNKKIYAIMLRFRTNTTVSGSVWTQVWMANWIKFLFNGVFQLTGKSMFFEISEAVMEAYDSAPELNQTITDLDGASTFKSAWVNQTTPVEADWSNFPHEDSGYAPYYPADVPGNKLYFWEISRKAWKFPGILDASGAETQVPIWVYPKGLSDLLKWMKGFSYLTTTTTPDKPTTPDTPETPDEPATTTDLTPIVTVLQSMAADLTAIRAIFKQ